MGCAPRLSLCYASNQFTEGAYWQGVTFLAGPCTATASGLLNAGGNGAGILPDANGIVDLWQIPVGTYPVIQVRAVLSTTNPAVTPQLHNWVLIYEY